MSQYYSKIYQDYYNKLVNKPKSKYIDLTSSKTLSTVKSSIDSSNWSESGVETFVNEVLSALVESSNIVESNISNSLEKASDKTYDELVPSLEELKDKDAEYEEVLLEYNEASDDEKKVLEEKVKALEIELAETKATVDTLLGDIKNYNDVVVEVKLDSKVVYANKDGTVLYEKDASGHLVKKGENTGTTGVLVRNKVSSKSSTVKKASKYIYNTGAATISRLSTSRVGNSNNSNLVDLNSLGCDWKVINSAISVKDYYQHVKSNEICQDNDPSIYGDYCLAFAYIHSSNLKNGSTADGASSASNYAHAGEFDTFITDDKSELLTKIYDEVNKGNPVILQVNGNTQGTCRHFVTVVGYKNSVTSAASLKETDLLILDSWDGELERMDTSSSRFLTTGASCGKDYSGYRLQVLKS